MKVAFDKTTNLSFCLPSNDKTLEEVNSSGIPEASIVEWSKQYVDKDSIFIDIGADYGFYSVVLSAFCSKVLCYEPDRKLLNNLALTFTLNNCSNALIVKTIEAIEDAGHAKVSLIRLTGSDKIANLRKLSFTISDNNFPPMLIHMADSEKEEVSRYLEEIGYRVLPVRGGECLYLVADHVFNSELTKEISIDELLIQYENNTLDSEDWKVWKALAKHFRCSSKHEEARICIAKGRACEGHDALPFDEEESIILFYLKDMEGGYAACERIIGNQDASWEMRNATLNNQGFYMGRMKFDRTIDLPKSLAEDGYYPSSSSIITRDGGYLVNMRTVNYSIDRDGGCVSVSDDPRIHTRNFLLKLDINFNVKEKNEIIDNTGAGKYGGQVIGLEDLRLFGTDSFFCTCLDTNEKNTPQICLGTYDNEGTVTRLLPLKMGKEIKCEKNWIPFIKDNRVYFIYRYSPFTMYLLNTETGEHELVREMDLIDGSYDFRGSTNLLPYKNGYLAIVHQVYYASPRKYFHRFIWLNEDFTAMKYGKLWFFESRDIEYTVGLCNDDKGLIIPYSLRDNCCKLGMLSYDRLGEYIKLD